MLVTSKMLCAPLMRQATAATSRLTGTQFIDLGIMILDLPWKHQVGFNPYL